MIGARQTPELLPGEIADADMRRSREQPPAVAMAMERQRGVLANLRHPGKPDAVQADHQAGPAMGKHQI